MVWESVQAALERKESFKLEYRIRTADGAEKWVWEQGRGVFSAKGELMSLEGFITDITKRKLAEERLIHLNAVLRAIRNVNQLITKERNREKLLKDICDALTEHRDYPCAWIVAMDTSGKLVTAAGAGLEDEFPALLERLKGAALVGCVKKVLEQTEPLAVTSLPSEGCLDCPLTGKYENTGVLTVRMEYGARVHGVLAAYAPEEFVEDKEEQSLLMEVANDVALALDRMEQEQALQSSEEKYRDILESVNDLIQSVAPDGTILYVNRGWRETLGYSEEDVARLSLFDVIHPDSMAHCQEMFKRVLSGETVTGAEAIFVAKDGRQVVVEGSASCKFVNGEPVATMGIFRDVTQRRAAEEAERKLEAEKLVVEELRKLDGMKDEFVSIITHELRTPMTPIKSSVEMFLEGSFGEVTEQQRKYLDMMKRNIDRLSQFTTEVLSLSRLQAGRYAVNPEMLSVGKVADSAVELLKDKAQGKGSTIKLDIGAGLQAYADANALAQVFTNLVNNAIVHAGDGVEIVLSGEKLDGDFIEVSVADNGQGIPEEALPHLFDRFYQADRKKAPGYQGTGIGLSLCKGLVEAMGGEISVESKEGEGAAFRFTLPALSSGVKEEKTEK
jgi:PAS domain S-box-containing protein